MEYNLKQGESALININVLDNENSSIDMSTALSIRVVLKIKGAEVKKYQDKTKEPTHILPDYGSVTVDTVDKSKLILELERDDSKTFPIGEMYATVLLDFTDPVLTNKFSEYTTLIGTMNKGEAINETF